MLVDADKVVLIHYTLTDDAGEVLDSSAGREPLAYLHGKGNIIPGLENALAGKKVGEKLNVKVEPAQGYGERDEQLVQAVPRQAFESVGEVNPGMQFQAQTPQGETRIVTVTQVADDLVTVDANHPLAGTHLTFDVEVTEVRDATPEELEHGHVHGPGGHSHHA
jgi:FKBP-type peptidyl-prolyl cis-trans isomerase SlyD